MVTAVELALTPSTPELVMLLGTSLLTPMVENESSTGAGPEDIGTPQSVPSGACCARISQAHEPGGLLPLHPHLGSMRTEEGVVHRNIDF